MRISHFFIDRPIFAAVVSIVLVILGAVSFSRLPVAQYPEIAPPIINVTGQYPGASADVVALTVVGPIEDQINGVENMIYMSSNSTSDGRFTISVSFDIGTNLDIAQVQVQNRAAIAQPRLPADVRNIGVTVNKASPDLMMVVHLYSPDQSRDTLFISNYATLEIKDSLTRVDGVGSITVFGSRDFAMRVWLDPDRLQSLGMTATDVTAALQGQNIQVASGVLNQQPVDRAGAFEVAVQTLGRLADPDEFADIVVKQTPGALVRLKDVARIELAAQDYTSNSYLDRDNAVALAIFQRPGSNALATAKGVIDTMNTLSQRFPPGVKHTIVYNPTEFIQQSVDAVIETIGEAIILVVLVVIVFLQTWRAAIIPIVAIPVSLVGTFFFMGIFGFTLNNLSLFGLVLAIGIVVDDAIVVVENVERNIATGLSPRDAATQEHGRGRLRVGRNRARFVRGVRAGGIHHRHFRAVLSPVRPHHRGRDRDLPYRVIDAVACACARSCSSRMAPIRADRWWEAPVHGFFRIFNWGFDGLGRGYGSIAGRVVRVAALMLVAYVAILAYGLNEFRKTPVGFHSTSRPRLSDRSGAVAARRLAGAHRRRFNGASIDIALQYAGRRATRSTSSGSTGRRSQTRPMPARFSSRSIRGRSVPGIRRKSAAAITRTLFQKLSAIQEALIFVVQPPPVSGIGNAGGFRMMIEDRAGLGPPALQASALAVMGRANQTPGLTQVFTLFETSTPELYLDIDRAKAQLLGVSVPDVFSALQVFIGSIYVNDLNLFGRTFRVMAQADGPYRANPSDILKLRVRNSKRRHRAARLFHHGAQHLRPLSGATLQSLPRGRDRRRGRARLFPGPSDRHDGDDRGRDAAGRIFL